MAPHQHRNLPPAVKRLLLSGLQASGKNRSLFLCDAPTGPQSVPSREACRAWFGPSSPTSGDLAASLLLPLPACWPGIRAAAEASAALQLPPSPPAQGTNAVLPVPPQQWGCCRLLPWLHALHSLHAPAWCCPCYAALHWSLQPRRPPQEPRASEAPCRSLLSPLQLRSCSCPQRLLLCCSAVNPGCAAPPSHLCCRLLVRHSPTGAQGRPLARPLPGWPAAATKYLPAANMARKTAPCT